MTRHIGTKLIDARPMTRQAYNDYRGWPLPADENGDDAGYLVEYLDGGQANHPDHAGYISWSPAEVFEKAYRPVTGMSFGLAIEALKAGQRVARAGWNGKGMWLAHVNAYDVGVRSTGFGIALLPWIGMKTADGCFVPWLASQTDMLADDWQVVT
ncbi:DUF2829 domain-containing protein [uncultured Paracoccus sp.]|uniref:DUF2829 domain-containing protein n=1 Tax=uncultured Paracoccus sp. TaxID=189685 RepID=UPI0030D823D0|tara:strand:+ start:11721 stop:12185 length:465 start_codon:yes stop_codon:yes gene_type:complete